MWLQGETHLWVSNDYWLVQDYIMMWQIILKSHTLRSRMLFTSSAVCFCFPCELSISFIKICSLELRKMREGKIFLQVPDSLQDGATASLLSTSSPIALQSSDRESGQSCRGSTAWWRTRTGYKTQETVCESAVLQCDTWEYNTNKMVINKMYLSASHHLLFNLFTSSVGVFIYELIRSKMAVKTLM